MRTPIFELHILPLFRIMDREGMLWAFDLYDYNQVVQHAEQIADRAATDMPPVAKGGPWPQEFVDLFRRWMQTGYKKLELGAAEYLYQAGSANVTITANGVFPQAGCKGWLELDEQTDTLRRYTLYVEPPDTPQPGDPQSFSIKEKYKRENDQQVFIRDKNGDHLVH